MSIWNGKTCKFCTYAGCDGGLVGHSKFSAWLFWRRHGIPVQVRRFKSWITSLDYSKIQDIEIDGLNHRDAPDYVDAYISSATYRGQPMSEKQLDRLNQDSDFVYRCVMNYLY